MWSFKVLGKLVEVGGITLVVTPTCMCDDMIEVVPRKFSKIKSMFYPENIMMERSIPGFVENIVKSYSENKEGFFIVTGSVTLIRAVECLSDLYGIMDDLDVYRVDPLSSEPTVENVMYSEYGISSLYEEILAPLSSIEERLNRKFGEYEDEADRVKE